MKNDFEHAKSAPTIPVEKDSPAASAPVSSASDYRSSERLFAVVLNMRRMSDTRRRSTLSGR